MKSQTLGLVIILNLLALPGYAATNQLNQASQMWQINPANSHVSFSVKNMGLTVKGKFNSVTGDVAYNGHNFEGASVRASVDPGSIDTGMGPRDHHLKSKDFFNVTKFPEMQFHSEKVVPAADGSFDIVGILTMHGVPQEVTLKAAPMTKPAIGADGKAHISTEATANLNRKDFSIGGLAASTISSNVDIQLKIDLQK